MKSKTKKKKKSYKNAYIPVSVKFKLGHTIALGWMLFSIYLSIPWINDLSSIVPRGISIAIIAGIGYIPGYINAFNVVSLLLDRQPKFKTIDPKDSITILISCWNEEENIVEVLKYIKNQDYQGKIKVIVIDNASTDMTFQSARKASKELSLDVNVIQEFKPGKNNALNTGLKYIDTEFFITLDADTILNKSAVRYIVARMKTSPEDVSAVAGNVLVKNSRENFITRLQEWDYFLGISSIKRMQGLFQSTLVAQGAFSLYKTEDIKAENGWPDAIGEDIVLTWNLLRRNKKVYFEPLSVGFTEVPPTLKHLARQRSRWARGMIEALKLNKPWHQPERYASYLTGINLIMPYLDIIYTFCWIPGLILAFLGKFWIVGPMTLFVLPLAILQNFILYRYQSNVFEELNLKVRKNILGLVVYTICYQMIMSPISIWGYIQEVFKLKRIWE